ncbi:hypothetical protein BDV28DRAFT_70924 [Aspergillus coremiiformis]|uniref:Uncharacterized protein n=1 Tax=Aspergillus coremiiformis TaxID=138285 RepID=A0A5N6YVS8_9EURO|nr:hypothetical protein BDV28DRAFT_70924 [Aspergillus coremiiformis]
MNHCSIFNGTIVSPVLSHFYIPPLLLNGHYVLQTFSRHNRSKSRHSKGVYSVSNNKNEDWGYQRIELFDQRIMKFGLSFDESGDNSSWWPSMDGE